jgi:predicted TIM-barrel fold metal-dependent hydrolase
MTTFKQYPKVDTHAHYVPKTYLDAMNECFGGNPDKFPMPEWSPEIHSAFMEEMGISYSLVSVSSPHINFSTPEYNAKITRKCNDEGAALDTKKFGVMANLPIPDIDASLKEIAFCCDTLKVAGFALPTNTRGIYIVHPSIRPVFEELNRREALVTFHPNKPGVLSEGVTPPSFPIPFMEFFFDTTRVLTGMILSGYTKNYPRIKYLIPHCGALLGYIIDRLRSYKPVLLRVGTIKEDFDIDAIVAGLYYDLAGSAARKQFPDMRQSVSDSHFFYASDYPFTPNAVITEQGTSLYEAPYMDETLQQAIFYKNAEALLGKKLRTAS